MLKLVDWLGGCGPPVQIKKIETIETHVVLIWNMEHSQDNASDASVGFEVSKAPVVKIDASKFKVVAGNSNWRSC